MALILTVIAHASQTNVVPAFALQDQFGQTHSISFPREKACVLMIGDREGSQQLGGWSKPVFEKLGQRVDIFGLADLRQVPQPIRPLVRDSFKEKHSRPILLDWDGAVVKRYVYEPKQALVLVVDSTGTIRHRATGVADEPKLAAVFASLRGVETDGK